MINREPKLEGLLGKIRRTTAGVRDATREELESMGQTSRQAQVSRVEAGTPLEPGTETTVRPSGTLQRLDHQGSAGEVGTGSERRVAPLIMRDAQTGVPIDINFAESYISESEERIRERERRSPMGVSPEIAIDITFGSQPPEGLVFVVHEVPGDARRDRYYRVSKRQRSAGNLEGVFVEPVTGQKRDEYARGRERASELADIAELHSSTQGVLALREQGKLTREHLFSLRRDRFMAAPGGRGFAEGTDLPEPRMSPGDRAVLGRASNHRTGRS